jgi:molybdopterin/thiamine biosynthesis adenylyltransferase
MITIIGAGALGSHVVLMLRNLEEEIRIVDFDKVEQKNIMSQFHTKMSMGKNKAQALVQSIAGLFGVRIVSTPYRLTDSNVGSILVDSTLVIDCTDNIAARDLIQYHCKEFKYPCLHGALSADGQFGRVMWTELFAPDEESGDGATCEDGEHLPFIASVASRIAIEAQGFLKHGNKRSFHITPASHMRMG